VTTTPYPAEIRSLPLINRGKVRDLYAVDADTLLIVASDRISAFDVILEDLIPGKGQVLTTLTEFWLAQLADIIPNHTTTIPLEAVIPAQEVAQVQGRAMVVKRLKPILIEAVARGYLCGSAWQAYQASGTICGIRLPKNLRQGEKLPYPIFTPAAKAAIGAHDENVRFEDVVQQVGRPLAEQIRDVTLRLYETARDYAARKGIIIADTKFEFGQDSEHTLYLMDEVLTPDSSRFWPADQYAVGGNPPSFDKQFVRDWLATQPWDKTPPAPRLPAEVVQKTAAKYREALTRLTSA
jgi:phosphoribosylaminoimidazole-succinocarboxamide synthase